MRALATLLVLLSVAAFTSGCASPQPENLSGHYAYIDWNESTQSCTNNNCDYGTNNRVLTYNVTCGPDPILSWDLKNWIHGSMVVRVLDPTGAQADKRTLSSNSHGSAPMHGPGGAWTLEGTSHDANGNLQVRLTCA
ncbi:MAG: hypothetical protein V4510_09340 [bacterium]